MIGVEEKLYELIRAAVHDEMIALGFRATGPEPDLESLKACAARFGVSVSFLEARHAEGALAYHGHGRMRRVRPAEVKALMHKRQHPAPVPTGQRATEILASLQKSKREP